MARWLARPRQEQAAHEIEPETTTRPRSPSLDLTDMDKGQMEGAPQALWAQKYEQMLQDEAAEAQHVAGGTGRD